MRPISSRLIYACDASQSPCTHLRVGVTAKAEKRFEGFLGKENQDAIAVGLIRQG
ncbi:hypothetical protein NDA01_31010 [Trichocoleus desertorum AS-A10]|uniref:hypothetical protein n=1 Tax=Trichocoleus desertorum TaxID=1481672 RepID=UPI00329724CC